MNKSEQLFNRNFLMVIIGQMISIFGNAVLRFALPLYILDQTGSTSIFGSILAISTIPTLLFSPLGGILADRVNRRNLMVILDMITAVAIGVFSLLFTIGPVVILISLLMVIFSIIQSFYQPVVQASIPTITSNDNLEKANGIVSLVSALSNLVGPLLAGVLYGTFGIWPIMITGIICFFLAAVMETFIKMDFVKQEEHDNPISMIKSELKVTLHFISKEKPIALKAMIVAAGLNLCLTSMILVGLPAMITVKLSLDSHLYGFTQGAMAAGMIAGGVIISILGNRFKTEQAYIMLLLASAGLVPMGIAFSLKLNAMAIYWVISLSCFFIMVLITIFSITMMSFVQRETPNHLIGKVISYILVLTQCTLPIGQMLYGIVFENFMDSISVIIFVTALCSCGVAIYSKKVFKEDYSEEVSKSLKPDFL